MVRADGQANPTFLWQVGDLWGYLTPTLNTHACTHDQYFCGGVV